MRGRVGISHIFWDWWRNSQPLQPMQSLKHPRLQLLYPVVAEEPGSSAEERGDPQTPLPTKASLAEAILPQLPTARACLWHYLP